jgi:diguanylate cyclase (GGDEF)-like protein
MADNEFLEIGIQEPKEEAVAEVLAREFFQRGRVSILFLGPVLFALFHIVASARGKSPVQAFLWTAIVAMIVRAVACWRGNPSSVATRRFTLVVTALLGTSLGAVALVSAPYLARFDFALVALCATGLNSVASISMATSRAAFLSYMVPNVGAIAVSAFLWRDASLGPWLPPLVLIYLVALATMSFHVHASRRRLVVLQLQLRGLAQHDSLTRLPNRRFLAEFMDRRSGAFAAGASGGARALGVLVVDVDHFKRVNDRHGHAAGDLVLKRVAGQLERCVRGTDVVARWGGEEFVILAPDAGRAALAELADRIRKSVEAQVIAVPTGKVRLTCSIGYTAWSLPLEGSAMRWEPVISLADRALGHAKETGRNRSVGVFLAAGVKAALSQVSKAIATAPLEAAARSGLIELEVQEEEVLSAAATA